VKPQGSRAGAGSLHGRPGGARIHYGGVVDKCIEEGDVSPQLVGMVAASSSPLRHSAAAERQEDCHPRWLSVCGLILGTVRRSFLASLLRMVRSGETTEREVRHAPVATAGSAASETAM
jgi:hypothetical protein